MGCLAVAWIANSDFAFSTKVQQEFSKIGHQALVGGFVAHVMRGVFSYRRRRGANVLRGDNRRKFLGSSHRRILISYFSGERCWGRRTCRSAQSRPSRLRSEKQERGVFSSLEHRNRSEGTTRGRKGLRPLKD